MPEVSSSSGNSLLVVSNREPYLHARRANGSISVQPTTGGVSVALDALMRARGGTWVAAGTGNADKDVVDAQDRVAVPVDHPAYALRRIWLSEEEDRRYYNGFANEGLWPLAHIVHVRPRFRSEDWAAYQRVNERFAAAVAEELTEPDQSVFIQDYHLALVAGELRRLEPRVRTAFFWHIPWPDPDRLRICPWRQEIMKGLLANDVIAFQLEHDRRNFLLGVRDELDASVDRGVVTFDGHATRVIAVPIGVDFDRIDRIARDPGLQTEVADLFREERLDDPSIEVIGVSVDRLDYTKGILERLDAIDRLLTRRPELRTSLAFVQVGVPSRSTVRSYAALEKRVDARVAEINTRHGQGPALGPIRYRKRALELRPLVALYRLADFCVVSSLHDGMNLVAKEFVAAREDLDGVLVLSEMAGAAQELTDAVLMNPYHVDGFAQALEDAIDMSPMERTLRMRALRRVVSERNIFRWATHILDHLETSNLDGIELWRNVAGGPATLERVAGSASNVRG
jgi:alpha,alpha-trehalose-phosphate synthase [UDP-forming]